MSQSGYALYTRELETLAWELTSGSLLTRDTSEARASLNGQASERLRQLVPLGERRRNGAFFTSGKVRLRFEALLREVPSSAAPRVWDPSCGAGDLLLAAAAALPLGRTLQETLSLWGGCLRGSEVEPAFVEAARLRLFIAAAVRHLEAGTSVSADLSRGLRAFRNIRVEDGLSALRNTKSFRGKIFLNPPFGSTVAEQSCDWAQGATSQAAFFALEGARALSVGSNLIAILPDVLRSGSRYRDWRDRIARLTTVQKIIPHGQFDAHTDVDVFLMSGERRSLLSLPETNQARWWSELSAQHRTGDYFTVNVGPVVDNRSPHSGPEVPFLIARDLPASGATGIPARTRRFDGRLTAPPFVALRRTSRPGQGRGGSTRAAGVMITGDVPVAVDNHIITAKPISGREADCLALLKVLDSPEINEWLDQRIRCRHLTVGIVCSLPWEPLTQEKCSET